jgi:LacI family transcriptional regulator, galactose operon repressor
MKIKPEKKYSLAKIAQELGTSKTAVSFVVNGTARSKRISEKLEKRISDFCEKVGYMPNIHAQRMNSNHSKNIGILIDKAIGKDEVSPFSECNISKAIGGIAEAANAADYRFSFQFYSEGMENKKIFEWFKNKEIDGLIYYGFEMPKEWCSIFKKEKFKVIGISIDPAYGIPCINVDNYKASFRLTEHLIKKGHQKFIYIAGDSKAYPGNERYRGFRDALQKDNISFTEDNFFRADFNRSPAENFIKDRWMHGKLNEDAIVCANDNMAVGVISALNGAGLNIPEQIAVVGADNISLGTFITPSLTTFDYLPFEQGKEAFTLLYDIINGSTDPENVMLKTTLCLRNSG